MTETNGTAFYFNEIDKACTCAKQTGKPILIHFRLWASSHSIFEDKIISNNQVQNYLNSKVLLLSLMIDDKKGISLGEYSHKLDELGFENANSVGKANQELKKHLIGNLKGKAAPQFILVDHNLKPLSDSWGYTSSPKVFLNKAHENMK